MEISEGNKIIAEFMGGKYQQELNAPWKFKVQPNKYLRPDARIKELMYHEDYNWLMPVVEKITPLAKQMGQQAWFDVAHFFLSGNIKVVHQRVVDFIVWHNSTLLKQTT